MYTGIENAPISQITLVDSNGNPTNISNIAIVDQGKG
jgi:hypothetical protein